MVPDLALRRLAALAVLAGWRDVMRCQEGWNPGLHGLTDDCLVEEVEGQAPGPCPCVGSPGAGHDEGDAQVVARIPHCLALWRLRLG